MNIDQMSGQIMHLEVDKFQQNIAVYYSNRSASCSIMIKGDKDTLHVRSEQFPSGSAISCMYIHP